MRLIEAMQRGSSYKALTSINLWCRNNKLTIHTGKSEVMIWTHKPFCGLLKPVMLGNKVLDFVTETKCLAIIIDNQLSLLSHIEVIFRSFGQKVNQLKRLKYLTKDTLQSIYFTSIIPTVTYCNSVWGTSSPTLLHEVEHIHASAAKIIYTGVPDDNFRKISVRKDDSRSRIFGTFVVKFLVYPPLLGFSNF